MSIYASFITEFGLFLLFGLLALGISTRSGPSWMEPTEHMLVHSSRIPIYSV